MMRIMPEVISQNLLAQEWIEKVSHLFPSMKRDLIQESSVDFSKTDSLLIAKSVLKLNGVMHNIKHY